MRPTTFKVDNTVYWTIRTYTDAGVLVDADATPSIAVRKNGASVADAVTVTKRAATTGIYDCSYNPAGEAEGDCFTIEESATISAQAYENSWGLEAQAAERGTDGANTVAPVDVSSDVSAILADTDELQQNQGDWATATGFSTFDASSDAVITDTASRNASKADTTGLSTFDPSSDLVVTDAASRAASKADVSGLSTFDAATDQVVASNMRGTDGANTVAPDNVSITAILADTNELQGNQADWATATGFATAADVTAALGPVITAIGNLNDFNPALDVVAHVTLVDTTTDLTNGGGGGGGDATSANQTAIIDAIDALNDFNPAVDTVARVTLVDTTTDLTNQTAGGIGMFQASVLITDSTGNALQGARVNVDGTTLSLTTGVSGEVQFNLDSGVYLLNVLPPANYDTPTGQVLTITASDPAQTVFALTSTSPPGDCDVPWIS